jgi:hypothetical protein
MSDTVSVTSKSERNTNPAQAVSVTSKSERNTNPACPGSLDRVQTGILIKNASIIFILVLIIIVNVILINIATNDW